MVFFLSLTLGIFDLLLYFLLLAILFENYLRIYLIQYNKQYTKIRLTISNILNIPQNPHSVKYYGIFD